MTHRRRSITARLLALVVLALVFAACGGGSDDGGDKSAYEKGMRDVGAQISKASQVVAELPADATNEQRAATTRAQGEAITDAAELAADLDPPSDARKDHDKLVKALRDYGSLLDELADASNNSQQQTELLGRAGDIVKRLQDASNALCKGGYKFGTSDTCGDAGDSK